MAYRTTGNDAKKVTDVMRWEVWARDNFTCLVCGSRMFLEIDHITPVSKGGSSHLSNLQTLCQNCNVRKRDHSKNLAPGESCSDPRCGHASNSRRRTYEPRDIQDELDYEHERKDVDYSLPLDL